MTQGRTGHTGLEVGWHAVLVRKDNPCCMQTAVDRCGRHAGVQRALHQDGSLKSVLACRCEEAYAQGLPQDAPWVAQADASAQLRTDGFELAQAGLEFVVHLTREGTGSSQTHM